MERERGAFADDTSAAHLRAEGSWETLTCKETTLHFVVGWIPAERLPFEAYSPRAVLVHQRNSSERSPAPTS